MGRTGCFEVGHSPLGWTLLFSWAVLTGCLANKLDLNDKQVASLALSSPGNDSICPGEKVPLVVTATLASGEKLQTEGPGGGKVSWSSFIMETRGAQFASQGFLTADQDPRETIAWPVHVIAHLGAQGPFAELDLPLTYACTYVANFNGRDGDVGGNGANGDENSPGESGGVAPMVATASRSRSRSPSYPRRRAATRCSAFSYVEPERSAFIISTQPTALCSCVRTAETGATAALEASGGPAPTCTTEATGTAEKAATVGDSS